MIAPVDLNNPATSECEDLGIQFVNIVKKDSSSKQAKMTSSVGHVHKIKQDLDTKSWSDLEEEVDECGSSKSSNSWNTYQMCEICDVRKADTCVVHVHPDCHYCFCYLCALQNLRESGSCPLCAKRIAYIYVYGDV